MDESLKYSLSSLKDNHLPMKHRAHFKGLNLIATTFIEDTRN